MTIEPIDFLNGLFSLIFVSISILVGIKIILKYFEKKSSTFLYFGLTWIGITSPWWGSSISFINLLIFGEGISLQLYLLVTITLIPLSLIFYIKAITDFLLKDYQNLTLSLIIVEGIIFDIVYIYFTLVNPSTIGILEKNTDIRYMNFAMIYLIISILIFSIGGISFGIYSLKSKKEKVRLQGRCIIIAFISFSIGAFLDSSISLNFIALPIARIVLISSSFEFYAGFILPSFMKKLFLKNTQHS